MYLKSIEIQGFKSFANKTLFEFHNGITGIVGPNGSGKSNVADAVRWVLGEQSAKQLRGSSMQDVIFAGTQMRKPQGFASVAITFDNADHRLNIDYDEVTVTRRVYRSGESEYLLNQTACRLRDIHELFFDTGIGKEGYSVIGQGQIERILSSKPDERRELFDEAAGIVKFKYRKTTAQKKLESEQASMVRLEDILSELEKQLGPLERQSNAAREYLKLRDELRRYEINAYVLDTAQSEQTLKETESNLDIVSGDHAQTSNAAAELKEQYTKHQESLEEYERRIGEEQDRLEENQRVKQEREGEIRSLQEQINMDRLQTEHANARGQELKEGALAREEEKRQLEMKRQELNRQIYDATSQSDRTRQESMTASALAEELQQKLRSGQDGILELLTEKSTAAAELQKYRTMLEQHRIQKAQLTQRLLQSKQEEQHFIEESETGRERLEQIQKELKEAEALVGTKEQEQLQLRQQEQALQNQIAEQKRLHQATVTRAEALRNLAERYEGYGGSIRRVMEAKQRFPGVLGVVADLIHVEKKYETAIETALGGNIQNIVTDTEQTAKHLIEFLKQNRFGRATFLPLDAITVKDEFRQADVLKEPGVIGLASSLVNTEARFSKVVEFLLGRIVVADTIDHAMKTAAKYHRSFRIVTLEGDLLNIGGSMTGGAFKNNSNLLGRNRELEELEKKIETEKVSLEQLERRHRTMIVSLSTAEKELAAARQTAQAQALVLTEAKMAYASAGERMEEVRKSRTETVQELQLLEQSIKETNEGQELIRRQVSELEGREKTARDAQTDNQRKMEEFAASREALAKQMQEQELTLVKLSQSDGFLLENLQRVAKEEEKDNEEMQRLTEQIAQYDQSVSQKEEQIAIIREQIVQDDEAIRQLHTAIENLTLLRDETNRSLKRFFERQEELATRLNTLDKELLRLTHQKERLEEFLDGQTEYLWNEYELRPSEAKTQFDESLTNRNELKNLIHQIKSKMKGLGNVNVNAIQEYREVSERWTFMKGQYDDLVKSRESLLDVIRELDAGMRAQFEEKFAEIRQEFDKVFKELFGGGKGTLELIEGEDIIEAGISIIAQPPGKKLQNMMQLSGGEKALTAICLLFAIQNLKPSPFCLLDEIEAALDDSNVGRFASYLHKLSENTQFIMITHRRGTMNAADRLYGITMQEKGVSALVSVDLIEGDLDK